MFEILEDFVIKNDAQIEKDKKRRDEEEAK